MIPNDYIQLLALLQFSFGLLGILLRRCGIAALVSALVMFNGIILILCTGGVIGLSGADSTSSDCQSAGLMVLAVMVALATVGVSILYSFHRFEKTVDLDDQDRMRH